MSARDIKRYCAVKEVAEKLLETAFKKLGLSGRAYSRVLKVGGTIADLAGSKNIETSHMRISIGVWIGECSETRPVGSASAAYFQRKSLRQRRGHIFAQPLIATRLAALKRLALAN